MPYDEDGFWDEDGEYEEDPIAAEAERTREVLWNRIAETFAQLDAVEADAARERLVDLVSDWLDRFGHIDPTDALQLASIAARPKDWTVENGQIYNHTGPGVDEDGNTAKVLGDWIPNVRDESATVYTFVPNTIPGESEDERSERLAQAYSTPAMKRDARDMKMLETLYADPDREPVVTIRCSRCSTPRKGKKNSPRKMGGIYKVDRSYVLDDAAHYTFVDARMTHLNTAMASREAGMDWLADINLASADVKVWQMAHVLDPLPKDHPMHGPNWPKPLPFDALLIGCQHHGNAMFSYAWLRKAGKDREDVMVDPQRRWFVVESDLPTDD